MMAVVEEVLEKLCTMCVGGRKVDFLQSGKVLGKEWVISLLLLHSLSNPICWMLMLAKRFMDAFNADIILSKLSFSSFLDNMHSRCDSSATELGLLIRASISHLHACCPSPMAEQLVSYIYQFPFLVQSSTHTHIVHMVHFSGSTSHSATSCPRIRL